MENILIVLVLVGALIYNIYNNYKKEMEKTARRDVRTPAPPVPTGTQSIPTPPPPVTPMVSVPTEVSRMHKYKAGKKIIPQTLAVETLEEQEEPAFDLRQAVIHTVILDRPHK
ncbi:hypothetical protein FAZ15_12185 [Sphingobacterium olei]|uniref:Uncharacterized protein n=1 Tax=Sphingobacterium olei TaxID=2571155 RepID=A0A4U0P0K0_9SPHI|nr:hypothetical protein [Sphingobacterium olei]TJZ60737.1 hypothetical protein FAZ15_12185 [Sphingobacterium olei]